MSGNRENVRRVLIDLVGRKDPTIFQDAETFERILRTQTGINGCPEISALKAGLEARIPWNLWEGAPKPTTDRNASPAILQKRSQELLRKFLLAEDLAVWAVETWALAVGLVLPQGTPGATPSPGKPQPTPVARPVPAAAPASAQAQPVSKPSPDSQAKPATTPSSTTAASSHDTAPAGPIVPTTRFGLIYGQDDRGCIRVFQVWWKPAPEAAGLVAVPAKPEPVIQKRLFTAAQPRVKSHEQNHARATASKPGNGAGNSISAGNPASAPMASPQPPASKGDEMYQRAMAALSAPSGKRDTAGALKLLNQAVAEGCVAAGYKLGELALKGEVGFKGDPKVAAQWFKWAADRGNADAQTQLGILYQTGLGVELNLGQARAWFEKAAQQGHAEAAALLNTIGRS